MKTSYSKGVLVWVDDNFIESEYLDNSEDIDKWKSIFGNISKKIYRLLDLELKLITTKSAFDEYIKENVNKDLNTYYYFILDLSVPCEVGDDDEVVNGLDMGTTLKDKNIEFCYLSSNSSAGNEMKDNGLGDIDYYIKYENKDNIMLPETLSHKILSYFKNNINWINLNMLVNSIDLSSNIFNSKTNELPLELAIFPFFDKYKDFIEITELESYDFNKSLFIKSHVDNSDDFEKQCILIMFTNKIFTSHDTILRYGHFNNQSYVDNIYNDNKDNYWFVKLDTNLSIEDFKRFYSNVKNKKVFYIIESNEDAERFLDIVDSQHTHIKVLPFINKSDNTLRSKFIKKVLNLLLNIQHITDNGLHFNQLYLDYPELLVHPLNINFLENPNFIVEEMSDSPEIIEAFHSSLNTMNKKLQNVIYDGLPLETNNLILVANDSLEHKNKILYLKVLIDTVSKWLKESWLYPYGIEIENYITDTLVIERWKSLSFEILLSLGTKLIALEDVIEDLKERQNLIDNINDISVYLATENIDITQKESLEEKIEFNKKNLNKIETQYQLNKYNDFCTIYLNTYNDISLVLNVIKSDVFKEILTKNIDEISSESWEQLSYLKWPHTIYPMPWYLNHVLSKSNKHLWIQHKNFNFVGYSKKLVCEYRKLNTLLDYYDDTLRLIKNTSKNLPSKMHAFIDKVVVGIEKQNLDYQSSSFVEEFKNFSNIALNITTLFGTFIQKPTKAEITTISNNMKDLGSFGTKLSYIRDKQFKNKNIFKLKHKNGYNYDRFFNDFKNNTNFANENINLSQSLKVLHDYIYSQIQTNKLYVNVTILDEASSKLIKKIEHLEIDSNGKFEVDTSDIGVGKYRVLSVLNGNSKTHKSIMNITTSLNKYIDSYPIDEQYELFTNNNFHNFTNTLLDKSQLNKVIEFKTPNKEFSDQEIYNLSICKANNKTPLRQVQNFVSYMNCFDMHLNILKFIDTIELYEFMTDTRNKALEHNKLKINIEYLFESFIYSYESLWLQYQYIVNHIENNNGEIVSNYIEFNEDISQYEYSENDLIQYFSFSTTKIEKLDKNTLDKILVEFLQTSDTEDKVDGK